MRISDNLITAFLALMLVTAAWVVSQVPAVHAVSALQAETVQTEVPTGTASVHGCKDEQGCNGLPFSQHAQSMRAYVSASGGSLLNCAKGFAGLFSSAQ